LPEFFPIVERMQEKTPPIFHDPGNRNENTRQAVRAPDGNEPSQPVFVVDDTFFRSRTPKAVHWSIAWSDLMMTMFILFLTLFIYQLAHRQFLAEQSPEVVAGTSITLPITETARIFHPISPAISNQAQDTIRRLATKPLTEEEEIDAVFTAPLPGPEQNTASSPPAPAREQVKKEADQVSLQEEEKVSPASPDLPATRIPHREEENTVGQEAGAPAKNLSPGVVVKPRSPGAQDSAPDREEEKQEIFTRIYDLSKTTLSSEKLDKFASVELIPDKAVRIILTGDLLFPSGEAELTDPARKSLAKLIPLVRKTPYMINVIGHTDSMPMHSGRYPSNWELSTARACRVARFLIEEGHIPPRQIVVAGYSFYRPVKPNTTASNRAANRRVEIILSREPAPPKPVSTDSRP